MLKTIKLLINGCFLAIFGSAFAADMNESISTCDSVLLNSDKIFLSFHNKTSQPIPVDLKASFTCEQGDLKSLFDLEKTIAPNTIRHFDRKESELALWLLRAYKNDKMVTGDLNVTIGFNRGWIGSQGETGKWLNDYHQSMSYPLTEWDELPYGYTFVIEPWSTADDRGQMVESFFIEILENEIN